MAFHFHLPDIGEGVIEGEVVSWKVAEGDVVALDQDMVEVMTDKATVTIPAPRAGTIAKIHFAEGEICPVGNVLVVIEESGPNGTRSNDPPPPPVSPVSVSDSVPEAAPETSRVLATPATRRLARRLGVKLSMVPATGKGGRVTSNDVQQFVTQTTSQSSVESAALVPSPPTQLVERNTQEDRIPIRGLRRRIADQMVRSKSTAPHFTYVEEIDVTELVAMRTRAKARARDRGVKLTYLAFIVKAICAGLKRWPHLNATLDDERQEIVLKKYYHIGIAVQGPRGLLVPVIHNADRRSIFDLAGEIERLGNAVEDGSIAREELVDSTFTITSLGKLGGVFATPILNYPEVGIVGVHKIQERPIVVNNDIGVRSVMNISISLDHRVVDGWDGAMFIQYVKSLLEDPDMMFLETI